jgi:DNA-binding NarL/FixJ family response regulator
MTRDQGVLSVRVLVVDDFEPFRSFVCSLLKKKPEMQVICEASDGLDAVQKAVEFKPDLILLDIGLPTLNGVEAAQRIRKLVPNAKILFLTQECSYDLAHEALTLGARGYVVKARAGTELLPAIEAVVQDKQFVSSGLTGRYSPDVERTAKCGAPEGILAARTPTHSQKTEIPHCHEVEFYSDDAILLNGLTQFVGDALNIGSSVIVIATDSHRESLIQNLQARNIDIAAAISQGRYVSLDAGETLTTFMECSGPDEKRFLSSVGSLVRSIAAAAEIRSNQVVAFGEMVALLCAEGRMKAAIELEQLWNELAQTCSFTLHCAYPMHYAMERKLYATIYAEHSAIYHDGRRV